MKKTIKSKTIILINKILSMFGLALIQKKKWRPKHEFEQLLAPNNILSLVTNNSMIPESRLVNIKEVLLNVKIASIEGDYVECGVWKGGSVAYAAYIMNELKLKRNLHLFDVYDDICEPDYKVDGEKAILDVGGIDNALGRLQPVRNVYESKGGHGVEDNVLDLLSSPPISYSKDRIFSHRGWFQDTLPSVVNSIDAIAVLRLDGDWYSSTKVCLEYLYDKVTKNGIIIIDDYACYDGCKKAVDEFLSNRGLSPNLIKVDDYCIYFFKN
jgi:O-methyltransferase